MNTYTHNRKTYLDILNILSMFGVIELHCTDIFINKFSFRIDSILVCLIKGIFIYAVPCFVFISGANLLGYRDRYNTASFFKKRFDKVIIPFIFWNFVWFLYDVFLIHKTSFGIKNLIMGTLQSTNQPDFWFFNYIIGLYLATPILGFVVKNSKSITIYLILLYTLFGIVAPEIFYLFNKPNGFSKFMIPFSTGMIGYYVLGYVIENYDLSNKTIKFLQYIGIVVGVIGILFCMAATLIKNKPEWNKFYVFWSVPVLFYSIGIFCFNKKIFQQRNFSVNLKKILKVLSDCSLGIFVIQQFIIDVLIKYFSNKVYTVWHILLIPIFVYLLCLIIIYLLKKIPFINRLVP